jgi:hypothetical protein
MRYLELGEKRIKTLPEANQIADRLEKRILHNISCDAGSNDNVIAGERNDKRRR